MENKTNIKKSFEAKPVLAILGISLLAFLFLIWVIYLKKTPEQGGEFLSFLPLVNCGLNTLSAISVIGALFFIKKKKYVWHGSFMIAGFLFSALFFISYSIYHFFHGDTLFTGTGWIRPVYFFILITHILLTLLTVPLIFWTFYLAYRRRWVKHRYWAKITYPLWLYISITGLLIYIFLKFLS
ncbi:hypothetical protein AB834_03170 [PVC group bacterium (ex Bugula neritina AB1)]|nr:hypothetical protein AB834_03170 [PVC group bacterium (ex Bugula neritina AB1)]